MSNIKDMTGKRFGRLVVSSRMQNDIHGNAVWTCICDCGKQKKVTGNSLRMGKVRSCGCLLKTITNEMQKEFEKRLLSIWKGMRKRCYDSNHVSYKYYGGRGITICTEWKENFKSFYEWAINNGYSDELSIDRIDGDKGYSPDNCRWITMKEQAKNRKSPHRRPSETD